MALLVVLVWRKANLLVGVAVMEGPGDGVVEPGDLTDDVAG
jgi:hypothetical protein